MASSLKEYWKALTKPGRVHRMAIHVPLNYRRVGENGWHHGATENISRVGVLFQAEQAVDVGTPVEISFQEPIDTGEVVGEVVACRGEVVRAIPPPSTEDSLALAARVWQYQFKPRPAVDIRNLVGDDRGPGQSRLQSQPRRAA
jgi:hypothetical protein